MARTFSQEDLVLLGYSDCQSVLAEGSVAVYSAKVQAGLQNVECVFIYLKSDVTNEEAKSAARHIKGCSQAYVIVPKSSQSRISRLKEFFGPKAEIRVHEEIIWEGIIQTFSTYLEALQDQLPAVEFYVTPRPEGQPNQSLDKIMSDWLVASDQVDGRKHITAILADPGIGKTTLSREVTRQLAKRASSSRVIPVYVEGSHWARLLDNFDDLWSLIGNSLRHFDPEIRLSRLMFEHLLRSGDLAFVFDGFDELCGQSRSTFNARQVLDELNELSAASSARIMLTSRTVYWSSEITGSTENIQIERLSPFTRQQALDLFEKRFGSNPVQRERARHLFDRIRVSNQPPTPGGGKKQIVYHPFVVDMIASAAEHGVEDIHGETQADGEMYQILYSFCAREQHRQQLKTSPSDQLVAFQEIAVEFEPRFTAEELEVAGFAHADSKALQVHPLLDYSQANDEFEFRYEFLPLLLRARFVVAQLVSCDLQAPTIDSSAIRLISEASDGSNTLLDHTCQNWPSTTPYSALSCAVAAIPAKRRKATSFLFHLAVLLANRDGSLTTKLERTRAIFKALLGEQVADSETVGNLHFVGVIEKLDFSGLTFESCTFEDAFLKNCDANEKTRMNQCRFIGDLEIEGGDRTGWGGLKLEKNCELSAAARIAFAEQGVGESISRPELATQAIELALGKFWKSGALHRSIAKAHWTRGPLGRHPLRDDVLKAMLNRGVLQKVEISGVSEGGYAVASDAVSDIQRYMDNRKMSGAVLQVFNDLAG